VRICSPTPLAHLEARKVRVADESLLPDSWLRPTSRRISSSEAKPKNTFSLGQGSAAHPPTFRRARARLAKNGNVFGLVAFRLQLSNAPLGARSVKAHIQFKVQEKEKALGMEAQDLTPDWRVQPTEETDSLPFL
jgi:hypothetical protein